MSTEYISENDVTTDAIRAGIANGVLKPWRRDGDGVLWFKSEPSMIHGGPESFPDDITAVDEDEEFDEAYELDEGCDDADILN